MIPIAATLRDGLPFLSLRVKLWLWTVLVFAVVQTVLALAWLALASDAGLATRLPELFLFTLPVGLVAAGVAAWRLAGRAVAPISKLALAAQNVSPSNLERGIDVAPVDREIATLQRELNDALRRIEEGYRAQESFLSDVSHELKTPIAGLLAEAQSVAARSAAPDPLRGFAGDVERNMQHLAGMVDGLLALSRAERIGLAQLRSERINVNDLALGALEACLPLVRELGVRVVPQLYDGDDLDVVGDPDLLRALVSNLLRNALQFSLHDGTVDLRVEVRVERVEISVRDHGPGCPPELLGQPFRRFAQTSTPRRGDSGSGLGLAIAQTVARRHGGEVELANAPGGGCQAIVRLPLAPAVAGAA